VERARDRVDALVQEIADAGEQVLVPSPALAEVLATPDCDMEEVLSTLRGSAYIRIGDFDQRAAVELAVRGPADSSDPAAIVRRRKVYPVRTVGFRERWQVSGTRAKTGIAPPDQRAAKKPPPSRAAAVRWPT
jgi:hypothetical protein